MECKCAMGEWKSFNGEVAIHFTGRADADKLIVFVFPKLLVCLRCGAVRFNVPERELGVLVTGSPVAGSVASPS